MFIQGMLKRSRPRCVCVCIYIYIYVCVCECAKMYREEKIQGLQMMIRFVEIFANIKCLGV